MLYRLSKLEAALGFEIVWLTLAATLTSLMTALLGLGGGVVLMLVMPGLMPLAAIIPVHAVVQFVSNAARVGFTYREIEWPMVLPIVAGSVVGALIGSQTVGLVSLAWLPAVAGVIILVVTWLPVGKLLPTGQWALFWLGFYQTGLGMLAGATGPLGAAVLARYKADREWLVVNTGIYMMINHGIRAIAFTLLGFSLAAWWEVILSMSVGMIVGAWLGTRLRQFLPQRNFMLMFKWLITVLAVRMLVLTVLEQGV